MAGVELDAEGVLGELAVDPGMEETAGGADAEAFEPAGEGRNIRAGKCFGVVAGFGGEVGGAFGDPGGAAAVGAPVADVGGEGIAAADDVAFGGGEADAIGAGFQRPVAALRGAVELHEAGEFVVCEALAEVGKQGLHAFGGFDVGPFEEGDFRGGAAGAEAGGGVDEEGGGVGDLGAGGAEGFDEVVGRVQGVGILIILPAGEAHSAAGVDAFIGEDVAPGANHFAGNVLEGEFVPTLGAELAGAVEGADGEVGGALDAGEQEGRVTGAEDEEGFFEAGVEAGEPGKVGEVFAVGVDG